MILRKTIQTTTCALLALVLGEAVFARFTPRVQVLPKISIDSQLNMPPEITLFVQKSCGDCHTSESHFPWYGKVPPVSWMLERDVREAHSAVDFTNWSSRNGRTPVRSVATLMLACSDLESGRMPLAKYLWLHPDAKPTSDQVKDFCGWANQESARLSGRAAK